MLSGKIIYRFNITYFGSVFRNTMKVVELVVEIEKIPLHVREQLLLTGYTHMKGSWSMADLCPN